MTWIGVATLIVLPVLIIRFLFTSDRPKLLGVYSQPGKWFPLKKLVMSIVLYLRFRQAKKQQGDQETRRRYGLGPGYLVPNAKEDRERNQPLSDHPNAIDSIYFNGMDHKGTFFVIRMARRNGRMCEIWLSVNHPKYGFLQSPAHPDTRILNTDGTTFTAGGLSFRCVEPNRRWKIVYNGLMRKGLCNEWPPKNETVHVKFTLMWEAYTDTFDFAVDPDPRTIAAAVAREPWSREFFDTVKRAQHDHYEQWGELQGTFQMENEDQHTICLQGIRDHSFGLRDWSTFYRYVIAFGSLEDGTTFHVNTISIPSSMSYLQCGYVFLPCGICHPITWVGLDMSTVGQDGKPPRNFSFKFSAGGKTYDLTVKVVVIPKYYLHNDWRSVIHECMSEFTVNGVKGSGIVEYVYRNEGGSPVPPEESVPAVGEVDLDSLGPSDTLALTLPFSAPAATSPVLVGGKGCQLALLTQMKSQEFVVPSGFCITLAAFRKQLEKNPALVEKITELEAVASKRKAGELQVMCDDVVTLCRSLKVTGSVEAAIRDEMTGLATTTEKLFAVRSSASGEDSDEMSAAGQMDTLLGVKTIEQILDAVQQCWASHFAFNAVEYRRQHGQPVCPGMGVVVQEMVKSEKSGVLFTRDPLTGNPYLISINANYGLGESVVSGSAEPDTITLSRSWESEVKVKDIVVGSKKVQINATGEGSTTETAVAQQEAEQCCLSENEALNLSRVGIMLEKAFAGPRDIEWAIHKEQLYLLQARPITTVDQESLDEIINEFNTPLPSEKEMLTTANIGEMLPGAVTPLTLSLFTRAVEASFTEQMVLTGILSQIENCHRFMGIRGNHNFINLYQTYGMCEPHSSLGDHRMLELALLGENLGLASMDEITQHWGSSSLPIRLLNAIRTILYYSQSYKKTKKLSNDLKTFTFEEHQKAEALYKVIDMSVPLYIKGWVDTVANSARSGSWSQILMAILTQGGTEWKAEHYSDVAMLLSSCEDVYSADVPTAIKELALDIVKAGKAMSFRDMTPEKAAEWLQSADSGALQAKFKNFLRRHGHRCVREAEFLEKSWQTEPSKLTSVLQAMLVNPDVLKTNSKTVLSSKEAIDKIKSPVTSGGRRALNFVLPRARRAVADREWGKSISIEMVEVFKLGYWRLAKMMVNEGFLPDEELLFYLTHREIGHVFRYQSGSLVAKAQKRRRAHAHQKELCFEKINRGHPQPIQTDDEDFTAVATLQLQGMPVSQGIVKGTVRVATSIQEASLIQNGDILVVPYTDVGWSPYFPMISGLITEMGGLISHGAVVAREYGLPCIVNVRKATRVLKTGDYIILDGTKGTCEKIEVQH